MPELPEVETIALQLQKEIPGLTIRDVWSDWPKTIQIITHKDHLKIKQTKKFIEKKKAQKILQIFRGDIIGKKIESIERKGKNILIYLSRNHMLLIHQKLTGHLLLGKWKISGNRPVSLIRGELEEKTNSFIHLILYLSDGNMLALSDLRKFAKVVLGPRDKILSMADIASIGHDPLEKSFKVDKFINLISSKKGPIKQVLMNQEVIAGIGNIYSDEILWEVKIHPLIPANKIPSNKLKEMFQAMRKILKFSIKAGGDSMSDFRGLYGEKGGFQKYHKVYQREGEPCFRCNPRTQRGACLPAGREQSSHDGGSIIKRVKMGGRSAHYCPKCQPVIKK